MSQDIIVIGTYVSDDINSYDWWQDLPNISEYDTIILDTTRILYFFENTHKLKHKGGKHYALNDDQQVYKKIKANLNSVKNQIIEKLEFVSTIYALYSPEDRISYHPIHIDGSGEGYLGSISTNAWCPISIEVIEETGKFIRAIDSSYQDYFKDFKEWKYYFKESSIDIEDIDNYYKDKWDVFFDVNPISVNKVEKPIAISIIFLFHEQDVAVPKKIGGKLVLLPVANRYDTSSTIRYIIQHNKTSEVTPPPIWVNNTEIPGESSKKIKLENDKNRLQTLQREIENSENELNEFIKYKSLLFETGISLQELVKLTLEKIGVKIKPSVVTDEFIAEVNGKEYLIEVKGNIKSITKDDIAQLVTDLMEHLKTTGQEIKGILIGNGWRLEPLEKRDVGNKPIFSRDAIRVAENHNIGLLSTTKLFKAYCELLENPIRKEEILNKIIGGVGIIKL